MDPQFLELMPYDTYFEAPTGNNSQGMPTYVNAQKKKYRCRIVGPVQAMRKTISSETSQLFTMWVDTKGDRITTKHRCTLPSDPRWGTDFPIIFSVNWVTDEKGISHAKVTFGYMYHRQGQT